MAPPDGRRVALPPWASWIGTPDYDADGVPRYSRWELHADAAVHACALAWAFGSGLALLTESAHWRRVVFTCVTVIMFVTSSLYNLLGCGHRIAAEPFRRLDQATIFVYFAGCYSAFLFDTRANIIVWALCGGGAFAKLFFGRRFEIPGMLAYLALVVAPLAVLSTSDPAYPFVASSIGVIIFGFFAGYLNNVTRGANVFWHACMVTQNVLVWTALWRGRNA
jgi:channel protein (hemolysin III family)